MATNGSKRHMNLAVLKLKSSLLQQRVQKRRSGSVSRIRSLINKLNRAIGEKVIELDDK